MQSARRGEGAWGRVGFVGQTLRYGAMREVLIATTNPGKLREIRRILREAPVALKTLADFPGIEAPEETGSSFAENARQKAFYYARATGVPTLAEDSGFEVDALNGEPGIYSARYLREDASYDERFADIFRRVRESGASDRSARFVCALAVASGEDVTVRDTCGRRRATRECALQDRTASATTRSSSIRLTARRSAKCRMTKRPR